MQPFLARRGDVLLGARHAVARKERVGVQVDVERHCGEASLRAPEMESAGFKEWAMVCEALGRGEQSIILRKGGIGGRPRRIFFSASRVLSFPDFLSRTSREGRA